MEISITYPPLWVKAMDEMPGNQTVEGIIGIHLFWMIAIGQWNSTPWWKRVAYYWIAIQREVGKL